MGGVFQGRAHVFLGEFRIGEEYPVHRVTAGNETEDVADHNARATDNWLARTDKRVGDDALVHE